MSVVNKPEVSKMVARMYGGLAAFLTALTVFFLYASFYTPLGSIGFVASTFMAVTDAIIIMILRSLFETRYVLGEDELLIKTTRLIGGEKSLAE